MTAAPGDTSRLFIVEKSGTIKILDLNSGQVLATPFLTVPVDVASERGLLGLAFDPDYATNGAFYVYATSTAGSPHNEVWRYHVSGNPNVAAAGRDLILDVGPSTNGNHNAGWMGFGPDGYLYIASGEVGVQANAQDNTNLLGKILRIDVDPVAPGYQIPADNPFVGMGGGVRDEIWAFGLRNPWRASFDSATGNFFIGNVGATSFEEINLGREGRELRLAERRRGRQQSELRRSDLRLSARQRRLDHRRLCLSRRERWTERPVFLRRFHAEHGLHVAVRRRELGRDRPHIADRARCRHGRSRRPRSARTRAAISTSSTSAARCSG